MYIALVSKALMVNIQKIKLSINVVNETFYLEENSRDTINVLPIQQLKVLVAYSSKPVECCSDVNKEM